MTSKNIAITLLAVVFIVQAAVGQSQIPSPNMNELFKQKKTQIRYLVQQIAALQVYLEYLKKGYQIVDKGLTTIGSIKDGTFGMDKNYLLSLKNVNPVVRQSPLVESILSYHRLIGQSFNNLEKLVAQCEWFTLEEKKYVGAMHESILVGSQHSLDELTLILTSAEIQMTDDERLGRLDQIHEDMIDKYSFTKSFASSTRLLALQRAKESHEVQVSRQYGSSL